MGEDRYHGWRNPKNPGGTFFVTTTTLDRAHRLLSPEAKDSVTRSLLQTSLSLDVYLGNYVVLSNHLHLIAHLPDDLTLSFYVQQLKRRAHEALGAPGTLWATGYRGLRLTGERFIEQKALYIANNPLKYGLAERPEDYQWSSAYAYALGCVDEWQGLDLRRAMNLYAR